MVATYSLFQKNLKDDTYVTEPNYAMRTSVMARLVLATFAQEILSPKHNNKLTEALKIFAGKI
jgi:predicted Rdx family selenoprotein